MKSETSERACGSSASGLNFLTDFRLKIELYRVSSSVRSSPEIEVDLAHWS
jgi:hypothetical protein